MFTVEQTYDLDGVAALARAARKVNRGAAFFLRVVCWGIIIAGAVLFAILIAMGGMPDLWMWLVLAALLALLLLEDRLDAWLVLHNMLPGTRHSVTTFHEADYVVTTDSITTSYRYENVTAVCETERYYLLFLGKKHGQIFDKRGFQTGASEDFRAFITGKTGLEIKNTK